MLLPVVACELLLLIVPVLPVLPVPSPPLPPPPLPPLSPVSELEHAAAEPKPTTVIINPAHAQDFITTPPKESTPTLVWLSGTAE